MDLPNAAGARRIAIALWVAAGIALVIVAARMLFAPQAEPGRFRFPAVPSSRVVEAPDGRAYQYVAAPNISWQRARAAAARNSWQGHKGYLATIGSAAEFQFIMQDVFPEENDVTYLGGRQTEPGQWRWVTGPEAAADGGKGTGQRSAHGQEPFSGR